MVFKCKSFIGKVGFYIKHYINKVKKTKIKWGTWGLWKMHLVTSELTTYVWPGAGSESDGCRDQNCDWRLCSSLNLFMWQKFMMKCSTNFTGLWFFECQLFFRSLGSSRTQFAWFKVNRNKIFTFTFYILSI